MPLSFDFRGFWFAAKLIVAVSLGVFLAKNIQYFVFLEGAGPDITAAMKPPALTASLEKSGSGPVTLAFAGDIMLDRGVKKVILREGNGNFGFPFSKIEKRLRSYDLLFANLEGPVSARGKDGGSVYSFRMAEETAEAIKNTGFDILSVANNHIGDWGAEAVFDTLFYLKSAGLKYAGAGLSREEASGTQVLEIKNTRFAFLAFTDISGIYTEKPDEIFVSAADPPEIIKQIQKAKSAADIIIVSFHFGEEYKAVPDERQKYLAYLAVDAGADLVIGHHPHVVQPIEKYKEAHIAYSLGNFIFDQNFSEETMRGMLLEVQVENKKITGVAPKNIVLNKDFQPAIAD